MEGITLGDRLIAIAPSGSRHGIYVGECRVISVKSGIVASEPLEEFCSGKSLDINLQTSDFAATEITRRAKSQIGVVYGIGNDQYFCEWCIRGLMLVPQN
jgi:hypothetical protein